VVVGDSLALKDSRAIFSRVELFDTFLEIHVWI